jgi:2,4-dienoyl-CoA reductase-like NADH-dependent reductase (Old Yellow Enzyme family)/thioredoxin reductase
MITSFEEFSLSSLKLKNRMVFPPIKTAFGGPDGVVTDRQLRFYQQIAKNGPGIVILEPASVTPEGMEHPKQLSVHYPDSVNHLKRITDVIHQEERFACLHLNHAGAAANPKATGTRPKAPSGFKCSSSDQVSEVLSEAEIEAIIAGYETAAEKAVSAGFDLIEIQGGHGYLLSQFLNGKINHRSDQYGQYRLRFAHEVLTTVKNTAPDLPLILRISGSEMSPEFGITQEELASLLSLAQGIGIDAVHVGMGSVCFSPPWYFHHTNLPEQPQMDALAWVRRQTSLPMIVAGRMGRRDRVCEVLDRGLADLVALGRPLIADPDLPEKWRQKKFHEVQYCGYCLQGCLHRVKSGEPLGCNLNPLIGLPELEKTANPINILVAGGGPAGMSAALYLSKRGHKVTLAEKEKHLGGQFSLAWQAPGKDKMLDSLDSLEYQVKTHAEVLTEAIVDANFVKEIKPDLLIWAIGAVQNIPEIEGLENQNRMTSIEYLAGHQEIAGPRVLVIGAGRTGLEIAEKLGKEGFDVVATKRTDPIGSGMDMITKKLVLNRIEQMPNVALMPHTTVISFEAGGVVVEKDSELLDLKPFQTVIFASGMLSAVQPDKIIEAAVDKIELIGDAHQVRDIYSAIQAGFELALKY